MSVTDTAIGTVKAFVNNSVFCLLSLTSHIYAIIRTLNILFTFALCMKGVIHLCSWR